MAVFEQIGEETLKEQFHNSHFLSNQPSGVPTCYVEFADCLPLSLHPKLVDGAGVCPCVRDHGLVNLESVLTTITVNGKSAALLEHLPILHPGDTGSIRGRAHEL